MPSMPAEIVVGIWLNHRFRLIRGVSVSRNAAARAVFMFRLIGGFSVSRNAASRAVLTSINCGQILIRKDR